MKETKEKCLICKGEIKDNWKVEGVIDIRSYVTVYNVKRYNIVVTMKDGFEDGYGGTNLSKVLREIAKDLSYKNTKKKTKGGKK